MSYHNNSNHLNLQHMSGDNNGNDHVYFSRITQQWEPVWFYASMLKKLNSFAQAIDRCAASSREMVWSHIFSLYNQPNRKCSDLFSPIIDEWCHNQSIDLSAIEIMYTSFQQIYNQYPALFEDLLSSTSQALTPEHPLSYSGYMSPDGKASPDFKKDESKQAKSIKLSNTSLIWGNSFASSIQQFSLLLNWAPLLEKLPPNQKEAIWNTCQLFPLFSEAFDRSSFRKTFLKWAGDLPAYLSHITILFAAIGFLRDKGIIKHQFFFPNTTVPVFNNGMKATPPSQYFPSSPQHFSPATSPISSPTRMSPIPSSTASSRSSSPATHVHDFQGSQPLHHFYSSLSASSPHPVLPTLDGTRSKSLPFESLSLPPISLSSAPSNPPPSTPNGSSSSSRLGLLALAAFQVDDDVPAQSTALPFPPLKSLNKDEEPSPLIPPAIKTEDNSTPDVSSAEATAKDSKDKVLPTPTIMKIIKRKNSCSEFHDDESKRPRTMNLSHILCS